MEGSRGKGEGGGRGGRALDVGCRRRRGRGRGGGGDPWIVRIIGGGRGGRKGREEEEDFKAGEQRHEEGMIGVMAERVWCLP